MSPFALQLAGPVSSDGPHPPSTPTQPPLLPSHPPVRPISHTAKVHRLSRDSARDSHGNESQAAGTESPRQAKDCFRSTHSLPTAAEVAATGQGIFGEGSVPEPYAASSWNELVRELSLEPSELQLSVSQAQQAMSLMGRTESIRDRHPAK